jgi:protease-4
MHQTSRYLIVFWIILLLSSCAAPRIGLFPADSVPLKEYTLQGTEKGKVLVISVKGNISDDVKKEFLRTRPSMVQEIVSQLRIAEQDQQIRALILKIDSPGGSATASDILYHEILAFKQRTSTKVVVAMMDVAASGGYYVALPADYILAHPTTITGSVGVVFLQPKVTGLMEKIGVEVDVNKSGKNKDMGSPFRPSSAEEKIIIQGLTDKLGQRFLNLVAHHRSLDKKRLKEIASARVYLADQALRVGLVDKIGYLSEAVTEAQKLAGLSLNSKVVVYRRVQYPNDNLYNTSTSRSSGQGLSLMNIEIPASMTILQTGFYYLWTPGVYNE